MHLSTDQRIDAIEREAGRIIGLATPSNLQRPVPSCPGWELLDVVRHLGRVYNWAGTIVEGQLQERPERSSLMGQPEGRSAVDWLSDRLDFLTTALRRTPAGALMWNFGERSPAAGDWWARRQANETVIHRVDAELAAGAEIEPVEAELAADIAEELLELQRFSRVDPSVLAHADGIWLHLHATDAEGAEWTIDTASRTFTRAHMKSDVALRGPAFALARWLFGRQSIGELETFGNLEAAESWRQQMAL